MKFRRRMKKAVKEFNHLLFEATDWYHSKTWANKKAEQYRNQNYLTHVVFEDWFGGWFVYIRAS